MKALRLVKPNDLQLQDMESKPLPKGWCRIKVFTVGVCGSDISSISGKLPFTKYPITPGHEFSGMVIETNECKKIKKGMFVTANPIFSCGQCDACVSGNINHCTSTEVLGVVNYDGAYAEELMIPEKMVFQLPDSLSEEEGAMIESVNVAVQAVERAGIEKGNSVAVFGAGNIGLLVVQVAKIYGAVRILVIDPIQSRLKIAKELGATEVITSTELTQKQDEYTESFTKIIDGVGITATITSGINLAERGGVLTIYGVPEGNSSLPVLEAFKKDMTICTSRLYPHSMESAIELVAGGNINFDPMITHRSSLVDFPEIYKDMISKKINSVKVLIKIGEKENGR